MKRLLFEIHRWGGIALALFMVLWFFSGLLIVFAEPPVPTRAQQLAHSEAVDPQAGWLSAGAVWQTSAAQRKEFLGLRAPAKPVAKSATGDGKQAAPAADIFADARLVRRGGEPLWQVSDARGRRLLLSALDGSLRAIDAGQAQKIAQEWAARDGAKEVRYVETSDKFAILRNQENLRPFHRFAIEDGAGGELLISAVTGEVVSASTSFQRGLYWAGNWVHLFRPLELAGASNDTRVEVLKWAGFIATVAALTGLIIGWLRWRPGWFGKRTYAGGHTQPYREAWLKWHFWAGLLGGVFALAWALSGFFTGNPWQLFSPANPVRDELERYVGSDVPVLARDWKPHALTGIEDEVVELDWRHLGDAEVLLAVTRDGHRLPQAVSGATAGFDNVALDAAVKRAAEGMQVESLSVLDEYDSYYYLRHHRDAADRPLPAVRVDLADQAGTHFYLDPLDGRLLLKTDRSREIYRWLYSALHHWDIGWLYQRPLWDGWMVLWIGFGLVLSVSSVVVGWRRLQHIAARRKHAHAAPEPALELATENRTA